MKRYLSLWFLLAACSSEKGSDQRVENDGILCVFPGTGDLPFPRTPPDQPLSYPAGQKVRIRVELDDCLSSSCTENLSGTCTVSTSSNTITVTSLLSWHDTGDTTCTSDCGFLSATCETGALSTGRYTIKHGDDQLTLDVGQDNIPPCSPRR